MSALTWIIVGVVFLVCAILLEAYLKRGKRSKPLHEKFCATDSSKPPLGMEATDIVSFNQANQLNDNLARHSCMQMIRNSRYRLPTTEKKRSTEDSAKIFTPKDK